MYAPIAIQPNNHNEIVEIYLTIKTFLLTKSYVCYYLSHWLHTIEFIMVNGWQKTNTWLGVCNIKLCFEHFYLTLHIQCNNCTFVGRMKTKKKEKTIVVTKHLIDTMSLFCILFSLNFSIYWSRLLKQLE